MKQIVYYKDLGQLSYKAAWDLQEELLQENVKVKSVKSGQLIMDNGEESLSTIHSLLFTKHHLLFVEHPPVYTLGKSGLIENVLISEAEQQQKGIEFFKTNRGGDITFHGPQQIVGYPILDLERFYTDIGKYLRNLEEVIILTMADYGLKGERSAGETGVWLDAHNKGYERKICAMGVRCSRWITMHGFAFNINTDLSYFDYIIPCGIKDKQVTSLEKELGQKVDFEEAKERVKRNFERVFEVELVE
ncbi:MAG: lipoyl(octanoyl) transferase LipB [Sphingobacteriales bacterium]|nr:lipoyl(octanoyl) transferase LipB [Sphingobacteriales bacterium]MBI3719503.1 lipoyl(octanoyl) transferase LipB [Sphingobacteriales bacterium]